MLLWIRDVARLATTFPIGNNSTPEAQNYHQFPDRELLLDFGTEGTDTSRTGLY